MTNTVYAQKVRVDSADPAEGEHLTTLEVTINGNGFGNSAAVKFFLTGTENLGDVLVEEVEVLSSKKLKVIIIIDDFFEPQDYDIEVQNLSTGRRGKGHTLFKVLKMGGGNIYPTFDVEFIGDMAGSGGTNWQSDAAGGGIVYWLAEPEGGNGWFYLDFFQTFFPDANCFGTGMTAIEGVQLWQDNSSGDAILNSTFFGKSRDGVTDFKYALQLKGTIDNPDDWLPEALTTVTTSTWKLRLAPKNLRKRFSDISCVDEGNLNTIIEVERN